MMAGRIEGLGVSKPKQFMTASDQCPLGKYSLRLITLYPSAVNRHIVEVTLLIPASLGRNEPGLGRLAIDPDPKQEVRLGS